ncbi:hypothetical protein D7X33_11030 [Butyricicoccus sp. 1XD8-22]|nr:hypothetical protein D7X33_11030 [Butyricicoccus sp. 1XD8-22]
MHSQAVNRPDLRSTISRLEEAEDDLSHSERLLETASVGWFPAGRQVRHFVFGEGTDEAVELDAYPVEFDCEKDFLPGKARAGTELQLKTGKRPGNKG